MLPVGCETPPELCAIPKGVAADGNPVLQGKVMYPLDDQVGPENQLFFVEANDSKTPSWQGKA